MAESLGSATLTLGANPAPLMGSLAAAKAKTVGMMRGSGAASAAAFAAGILAAGATVGFGLYKIAKTYDEAYNIIKVQTGATGEQLEKLKGSFKEVYGRTASDAKTVATALSEVRKRTGLLGEPLEELTLQFVRLSGITGTDAKQNIRAVTRAFGDWGVATKDQGRVLDGFFGLSQKTGIEVADLAEKLAQFGSPLRALGFSLDQSAAMFALFEKAGVNVSTMMPGLRMALKNMAKPSDDLAKKFKQLGVDTKDPQKALATVMDQIKKIPSTTDAAAFAMDVFGARAGTDMAQAIREGKFEVSDLVKVMKNSKGAVEEAVPATFEGRLKMLGHVLTNLLEPAATKLLGVLIDVAGKLVDWGRKLDGLPQPIKDLVGKIVLFGGGLAILAVAIGKAKTAFMALRAAMLMNPYVLIIASTVALSILIVKHWDKIKEFLSGTWKKIKTGLNTAWGAIRDLFKKHWKLILLVPLGPLGILAATIAGNWDRIKKLTGKAWEKIRTLIEVPIKAAAGVVRSVVGTLQNFVGGVWGKIRSVTGTAWKFIKKGMINPIKSAYSAIVGMISALKTVMQDAFNFISDKVNGIWEKIKSLPSKIPFAGGALSAVGLSAASVASPVAAPSITPSTAAAPVAPSGGVDVQISFADGMGWLREFVDVRIVEAGREAGQVYVAGGGGFA